MSVSPPIRKVDLSERRSIHIVGIGGAGMRAIARVLLEMGHHVSGSDRASSVFLDELEALGANVFVGHAASRIQGAEFLARSTAVPDSNQEVAAAQANDLAVYSRAEILAAIVEQRPGILVAGTHGKTTTSSMLAVVLDFAGQNPSFIIGSDVARFQTGARWAGSEHFVVEADESDGTFLTLPGAHGIVTSLDPDHLDFYGSVSNLEAAFVAFVDAIPGTTAVCIDDADTAVLLGRPGVVTYGTSAQADLRISAIEVGADTTDFDVIWKGEPLGRSSVGLPGHHNALNAAAAITIALSLGIEFDAVSTGLGAFHGVARRFETRGEACGVRFVDDYAHLPAEVEAAIATARRGPWQRVIATYQPHRFTRTKALGATFAESFTEVDELVLTDIYTAGEDPIAGITGRIVLDAVTEACPDLHVTWQPSLDDVTSYLVDRLGPGDLCLTLGAGDLTTVPDRVIEQMSARSVSVDWLRVLQNELTATTVLFNESLGSRTTYRVGGAALALAEVGSRADLAKIVEQAIATQTPIVPVGKGSNLLVADRGFLGLAIMLTGEFDAIAVDATTVTLGAATSLPIAARQLVSTHRLAGFEWAVGVPGTVGGAVAMNAGGHGSDMAASVLHATVLDLRTAEIHTRSPEELEFGYRTSSIRTQDLVLDATLRLAPAEGTASDELLSEIVRWRREHQPGGQNAGSVFTNPAGDSAGRLIDVAGGKGLRVGSAEVSDKHANFIQADPDGSADDVFALMQKVIDLVTDTAGIVLHPETRLVGFDR